MKRIVLFILILGVLFVSGCTSVSDFFSEFFGTKPYISDIKTDKNFYSSIDREIGIQLKVKNPTNQDYSPVRLRVDYPDGVEPVDHNLRDGNLIQLVSINAKKEKSYSIKFNLDSSEAENQMPLVFSIYNFKNYKFDEDKIIVEFSSD